MSTRGLLSRMRSKRIIVVFLAMLLAYGAVSYSPLAATPIKTFSVDVGGVTGAANNTVLAFGRFVLVAPWAPSKGVDENGYLDPGQLDNHYLYVVDNKKPTVSIPPRDLSPSDGKAIYFPTKVAFDPDSKNVYIRGTRFEETDGKVTAVDVIAYAHSNLDGEGKPMFDSWVPINIPGVGTSKYTNQAPSDFELNAKGNFLVFTNGASVFSYNLILGYVSQLDIVPASDYSLDHSISFLGVDQSTDIVSICATHKTMDKEGVAGVSSEISFYKLGAFGTFSLLTKVDASQFPGSATLSSGSNIAILSDEDTKLALFVASDGSLYSVDLLTDGVGTVKRLYSFPELAHSGSDDPSPVVVQYDSVNGVVGVVKTGFTIQISRPSNGRRGRISRPSNLHIASGNPVLAMARLGKKNKVTSSKVFIEDFKGEGGLSNFVDGRASELLISTYSGNLHSVRVADDLQESKLELIGPIGSRVEWIDYYADRSSVVAIESFAPREDGGWVGTPGSLIVARLSELQTQSASAVLQALLPTASVLGRPAPSIRRPCNIKR